MRKLSKNSSDNITIHFKNGDVKAGVAGSFLRRATGLSFRRRLGEKEGLFFIFSSRRPVFWNFGMRFPIDVVWIYKERIIGVEKGISGMGGGIRVFYPPGEADSALEMPAGSADMVGAEVGGIISAVYEG